MITEDPRVLAIRAEYLAGAKRRSEMSQALAQLVKQCPDLCSNTVQALDVLLNLPEADCGGPHLLQVESSIDSPGTEIFSYQNLQARRQGMMDHMAQAVKYDGDVVFNYYYSEVDPNLEKYSMAYFQALPEREQVGAIDCERQVYFDGFHLGTVSQVTLDGNTLYSRFGRNADGSSY